MDQNESQKKNQEYCKRESELFNIPLSCIIF